MRLYSKVVFVAFMICSSVGLATDIFQAIAKNDEQSVAIWLNSDPDVNVRNSKGRTPLMQAALAQNITIVQMLLDAGANKYLVDFDGKTAKELALVIEAEIDARQFRRDLVIGTGLVIGTVALLAGIMMAVDNLFPPSITPGSYQPRVQQKPKTNINVTYKPFRPVAPAYKPPVIVVQKPAPRPVIVVQQPVFQQPVPQPPVVVPAPRQSSFDIPKRSFADSAPKTFTPPTYDPSSFKPAGSSFGNRSVFGSGRSQKVSSLL